MTNFVYPTLPGLSFPVARGSRWRRNRQPALSGKRSSISYRQYPLIHWELQYEFARDDIPVSELKAIVGLFNACKASADETFLYTDPDFNSVTAEPFGTGNGTQTAFQL